ncbi:bile acid:sodium symporter family protein [Algoriphagus lacus]|uniref:Bile acid:sodium symporter family protein n=1 Tax=Algoriphagus lacus TaxID=2056311 RepID=A0A418PP72_9BACT|nr:bile acid:sodium symporter family protein [Algoriphagus lacus]RIW13728.1 bile acid:sodium symporter family protein [Algoriphagus lacus]
MNKIFFPLAAVLFITWIVVWLTSGIENSGLPLIGFFVALGLGCRVKESLKGFSFPIVIFGVVALAMFFPSDFQEINGYPLSNLITPLIQVIMFGMGTSLSLRDFSEVIKSPKSVLIGVSAQFLIMPLLGFFLASISGMSPEIAAGIILAGCSPSGTASNVMTYLAKANLALSVTLTSITTLMAPVMTPLLMKLLAGQFIEIDLLKMMWDIVKMIILPIASGLIFNKILKGKSAWLDKAMPVVSMLGIALIILVITAAGRDSLLSIGPILIVLVMIHNLSGYGIGYFAGKLLGLDERDARTVAIEVGMQNAGLASGLAKTLGKIATVGLAPAVFGPMQNITGSILASYWHKREVKD